MVTPKMSFGGDVDLNMGTTINKTACATNGQKLNSASHTLFNYLFTCDRPVSYFFFFYERTLRFWLLSIVPVDTLNIPFPAWRLWLI
ncbi:hypothetical protein E2C01_019174 [Portunus trituberculatus]|uniref:Uncharacterized protein n=1 Tax=Portunus trituberculatus TaxID=210409 RepID=A0A5B7DXJ7_PORTR|nr:hypothetical protein [Portunus trituberculatus]